MITQESIRSIKLPSVPESINKVEVLVTTLAAEHELEDEVFANMLIAVSEAVNNAIVHGNGNDPSKEVEIQINAQAKKLSITVVDQGKGFDYNNLPDPTLIENLEKPTGRGVFLMKELADMAIFSENGRCVELQFRA